jgi:PAS domain S-box-containing protein
MQETDTKMDVLKDILDNLNDSIVIIDSDDRVVLFNTEAVRIQNSVSCKPLAVGECITELESRERMQIVSDILKTLKKQKKSVKNFAEYRTPNGSRVFLEINYVPVLGPGNVLRYVNVFAQDITSRKLFESKLRASAAEANRILENAHAVVISVDSQGYIVGWNKFCAQVTGFAKTEVLSRKLSEFLVCNAQAADLQSLVARVSENDADEIHELAMRSKDGRELTIAISSTLRKNANGEIIGATLVGQDITELNSYRGSMEKLVEHKTQALQRSLTKEREAVEMKSRFVSIASHEFRTPLSSIDFAASFIKRNAATIGSKKLNEKVEVIEKHVSHMTHLLEDVLNYSRNEAGKIQMMPSTVDLAPFLQTVVEEVICNCNHSHHICLSTNQLGVISTDEKLLRNILINLMTNAIKFSPGREEICVNVLDQQSAISIEVRDDGIGIPEEEMGLIFDPFVRGKHVDAIPGTGLGLSIVKKSVQLLNGTIEVESRAGKGTVFKVAIPHCGFIKNAKH